MYVFSFKNLGMMYIQQSPQVSSVKANTFPHARYLPDTPPGPRPRADTRLLLSLPGWGLPPTHQRDHSSDFQPNRAFRKSVPRGHGGSASPVNTVSGLPCGRVQSAHFYCCPDIPALSVTHSDARGRAVLHSWHRRMP